MSKKHYLFVFPNKPSILHTMDKSWFQKLFRRQQPATEDTTQTTQTTQTRADGGDPEAQFSLGVKYANLNGGAPDYEQAARWYLKAADQSHALAQFNLGVMSANGQGMPQDEAVALNWFNKAARQGDPAAQHTLGMRHQRASFGELAGQARESKIEAFKWFHLAAGQGYHGSLGACAAVALTLTREEVAAANDRASAFVVSTS